MKKAVIIFILCALIIVSCVIWFFSGGAKINTFNLLSYGIIFLVLVFAGYVGFKRLKSVRRGEPAEDELSKKVLLRTAGMSYYISLYLWLAIMYFSDKIKVSIDVIIGAGILGMAVIYGVCWLVFNFIGIKNE
jgi:peptidoglycan/LPS O-acetylase OafA/YrhL